MTREEAILILGEFKEFCDSILWDSIYAERSRAIDMAIEALKEKNDDDSLLTDSAEVGKENECKLSRKDARYFLQGISDMFSLSPEAEMSLDMAIEALQEPKTIIGIDIPYGSDKGLATVFKGNEKMVLEEVKEIMSVVRCKDCRHFTHYADGCGVCTEKNNILTYQNQNDFCSHGERREE